MPRLKRRRRAAAIDAPRRMTGHALLRMQFSKPRLVSEAPARPFLFQLPSVEQIRFPKLEAIDHDFRPAAISSASTRISSDTAADIVETCESSWLVKFGRGCR
jgi:hypothetical protein